MPELNVEVDRACPLFLKNWALERFLMQVRISCSVTVPSLSTSMSEAYR